MKGLDSCTTLLPSPKQEGGSQPSLLPVNPLSLKVFLRRAGVCFLFGFRLPERGVDHTKVPQSFSLTGLDSS